jgi:D-alanine-D-alanine ligase
LRITVVRSEEVSFHPLAECKRRGILESMKRRVGVVRGGPSSEYDVSIRSGGTILKHLPEDKYIGVDLLITKDGLWHKNGVPTTLEDVQHHVDVIWNALHGYYGEDGKLQKELEHFGIPYTGSGVLPSAIAMNKVLAKERLAPLGVKTPRWIVVGEDETLEDGVFRAFRSVGFPAFVKPASGGSSVATRLVKNYRELEDAVEEASAYGDILVEEYIKGVEATVPVIDASEEGDTHVLHPIEIVPSAGNEFFNFDAKYSGASEEIYPGRFDLETSTALRDLAARVHHGLGLRHYSRSDFIVSPRGIYFLEANTLPGMTEASLLPKAIQGEGIAIAEFIDHVLSMTHRV